MGDPAGIGGELTLRAWLALRSGSQRFVALDDPERLKALAHALALDVPIATVASPAAASGIFPTALPVLPVNLANTPRPGHPDKSNAKAVIASIERAASLALAGTASGMVTNPINKAALYERASPIPATPNSSRN
jgi:4-hydroxythreonine-4-phosphate dehydrogenase